MVKSIIENKEDFNFEVVSKKDMSSCKVSALAIMESKGMYCNTFKVVNCLYNTQYEGLPIWLLFLQLLDRDRSD
jgi:hypothetical protein